MLGLLVLLLIGFVLWRLWTPAMAWAPAFATLLDRPVKKTGFMPFVAGLETAGGDFEGRPVLLALHHKRGRNSLGYLVVAMKPGATSGFSTEALATLTAPEVRDALEELESRSELHVSFEDGWLKARWQPVGFMIFPGQFEPQRWRRVLTAMSVVARSIESART
jgi:hypothetical protein